LPGPVLDDAADRSRGVAGETTVTPVVAPDTTKTVGRALAYPSAIATSDRNPPPTTPVVNEPSEADVATSTSSSSTVAPPTALPRWHP
jgi:hypothetical protein